MIHSNRRLLAAYQAVLAGGELLLTGRKFQVQDGNLVQQKTRLNDQGTPEQYWQSLDDGDELFQSCVLRTHPQVLKDQIDVQYRLIDNLREKKDGAEENQLSLIDPQARVGLCDPRPPVFSVSG